MSSNDTVGEDLTSSQVDNLGDKTEKIDYYLYFFFLVYFSIIFLVATIRTIITIYNEPIFKKLKQVTQSIVSVCSFGLLSNVVLNLFFPGYPTVAHIIGRVSELGILVAYILILLFWVHSLLEGDPRFKMIKHPKFFTILVITLVVFESITFLIDGLFTDGPTGLISEQVDTRILLLYSSYRTILCMVLCIGFTSIGYLIHRKAKRLDSKNVNRFKRTGIVIGITFFLLTLFNMLFDVVQDYTTVEEYKISSGFIGVFTGMYGLLVILVLFIFTNEKGTDSHSNCMSITTLSNASTGNPANPTSPHKSRATTLVNANNGNNNSNSNNNNNHNNNSISIQMVKLKASTSTESIASPPQASPESSINSLSGLMDHQQHHHHQIHQNNNNQTCCSSSSSSSSTSSSANTSLNNSNLNLASPLSKSTSMPQQCQTSPSTSVQKVIEIPPQPTLCESTLITSNV